MTRALAIVALLAASASANTWQRAIERSAPDAQDDAYDTAMLRGDELISQAKSKSVSIPVVRKLVESASHAYRDAAAAKPTAGEPWYRLGKLDYTFFFDCPADPDNWRSPMCGGPFDAKHAADMVEAWNQFEQRAPLDPRLSPILGHCEVLFERAIANTKLVAAVPKQEIAPHLEAAARDYEKLLARSSAEAGDGDSVTVLSNLAETYMMLDRLDDAIDTYHAAIRHGANAETYYGLAVALDRDERGADSADTILQAGPDTYLAFKKAVILGGTFFVPEGERFYYFALIEETYDHPDQAIEYWREYIKSGAHAEFQPRAKAHLDALVAKHPKAVRQPQLKFYDEYLP